MDDLTGSSVKDFSAGGVGPREIGLQGSRIVEFGAQEEKIEERPDWERDYQLRDWEKDFAAKHDVIYPTVRTLANLVPYGWIPFPSGRDEYAARSTGGQTLQLMFDALAIPLGGTALFGGGVKALGKIIGYPFKAASKGVVTAARRFVIPPGEISSNPFADDLMSKNVVKYVHQAPEERLSFKYGLEMDEAKAAVQGQPFVWRAQGRSGAWGPEATEGLRSVFKKDKTLKQEVLDDLGKWAQPREVQELNHYLKEMNKVFGRVIGGSKYEITDLFQTSATRVYGEAGKALRLDNVGIEELGNIMLDSLKHGSVLRRQMDISGWSLLKPVRKVLGGMDRVWGTYEKLYKPLGNVMRATNVAEVNYVRAWHGMLASKKYQGKPLLEIKAGKLGEVKLKEHYTAEEFNAAGKLATDIDLAQSQLKAPEEIQALMNAAPSKVQILTKTLHEWYDWMYADFMKTKIPQLFRKVGLTKAGEQELAQLMDSPGGFAQIIDETFRAGNNLSSRNKQLSMEAMLKGLKSTINKKNFNWFSEQPLEEVLKDKKLSDRMGNALRELKESLDFRTTGNKKGMVPYLDNYTARLPKNPISRWTAEEGLPAEMHAGFTKLREAPEPVYEVTTDIPTLISARARMQAKELYLYPNLPQFQSFTKTLPQSLKDYSEHYINRLLGVPSKVDTKVAEWLKRISLRNWDERRVVDVAQAINDWIYLGGIGFKPFSAMRNYIQPILMTPADMGGIKDIVWLGKGMEYAFKPSVREYIRSIGAIQEYAPDIAFNLKVSKYGTPFREKARDYAMWMFKASDHHNRYWSGGAALAKWDHYMAKYAKRGVVPSQVLDDFKSKLNLGSREEWVRRDLNELLDAGTPESFEQAKALFVNDVISDTQFLYSRAESPLIQYKWGAPGRVSLVFQSWWMNYGDELAKWLMRTPEEGISPTAKRMFTFMLSGAIAYEAMEPIWGRRTAAMSVGLGPLPLELSIPPTWRPFYDGAKLIANSGALLTPWGDVDQVRRSMTQFIKSGSMFIPGGVQAYQTTTAGMKEGLPGVLKSIIRYRPTKEKEE